MVTSVWVTNSAAGFPPADDLAGVAFSYRSIQLTKKEKNEAIANQIVGRQHVDELQGRW